MKRLQECEPGELLLAPREGIPYALIAQDDPQTRRFVIYLGGLPGAPLGYEISPSSSGFVTSLGREAEFDLNLDEVESPGDKLWRQAGVVVAYREQLLLRTTLVYDAVQTASILVDVRTGSISQAAPRLEEVACFPKWSIHLRRLSNAICLQPCFSFNAKSRTSQ
jgi:hypothetical protein